MRPGGEQISSQECPAPMNESLRSALYEVKAVWDAGRLFRSVLGPLQLEDHVGSFELSVARAPIDSTVDIIRFFLKDMELEFLPLLGNPRNQYAGALLAEMRGKRTEAVELPPELWFLQRVAQNEDIQALGGRKRSIKTDFQRHSGQFNGRKSPESLRKSLQIPPELQRQMTYLELKSNQRQNPWKLAAYEYIISRLSGILLDFDPEACYQDARVRHQYKLYSYAPNKLTSEDLGLPRWLNPDALETLPAWKLCCQCLKHLENLESPSLVLITATLILRYIEVCIGKLLEAEAYRKHVEKSLKLLQEQLEREERNSKQTAASASAASLDRSEDERTPQLNPLAKQESLFKGYQTQDLGMTFDRVALQDTAICNDSFSQTEKDVSRADGSVSNQIVSNQPTTLPNPLQNSPLISTENRPPQQDILDTPAYQLSTDPRIPPFRYEPKAFGMDECQHLYVYLMLRVRPTKLARVCSLAASFSFPPLRPAVEAGEYALMNLSNCCYIIGMGFERYKHVQYGVVRPRFRVVAVAERPDPLGVVQENRVDLNTAEMEDNKQAEGSIPEDIGRDEFELDGPKTLAEHVVQKTKTIRLSLRRK